MQTWLKLAVLAALLAVCAAGCEDMDKDYPGNDLDHVKNVKSWQSCAEHCRELSTCKFWTYNERNKNCWRKTRISKKTKVGHAVSGARDCYESACVSGVEKDTGNSYVYCRKVYGCSEGWKYYNEKCYKVFGERISSYSDARVKCQEEQAELATAETSEENTEIEKVLNAAYAGPDEFRAGENGDGTLTSGTDSWLGASRPSIGGTWTWVNDNAVEEFDWLPGWSPDENADNCLQTYRNDNDIWQWYTANCESGGDNAYICEKRAGPEPDYVVYNDCAENMGLWGHNTKFAYNVPTREECMQACRDEKSFSCLSIDYRRSDRRCSLQNQNKHTKPDSYRIAEDGSGHWGPGQITFSYCTVKRRIVSSRRG